MVWYIRFLKTPKLDQKGHVRALITITTDLGDVFYPTDLSLYAIIVATNPGEDLMSDWQHVRWKSGMRTLWIEFLDVKAAPLVGLRLLVNSNQSKRGNRISLEKIPDILGVWSDSFDINKSQTGSTTERRYRMESGLERVIVEDINESIARHIWDAGIALSAYLSAIMTQPKPVSDLAKLLQGSAPRGPKVLELGGGCGIVGLHVAGLCSTSEIFLTDLPDAMDILNQNVKSAMSASSIGKVATTVLDWDGPLPERIGIHRFDLVIVSDCTYNSDSIPCLVKTLSSIANKSPDALFVVSLKVRHDSEAIFFDMMAEAEFVETEHTSIPLPDRYRSETGQDLDLIEIFVYRSRSSVQYG